MEACRDRPTSRAEPLDLAIVIDTSISTLDPSGADVDGDGVVGELELGGQGDRFQASSDPGDSVLSAELGASRWLIAYLANADVRFSLVVFSDEASEVARLEDEQETLANALHEIAGSGGKGTTRFSAGMGLAVDTLTSSSEQMEDRRRVVLFMSDSAYPSFEGADGQRRVADPEMKAAAERAIEASIVFHTFGLGTAARPSARHSLSRIAGATGGQYYAVEDAATLHCQLLAALAG
jgi:hypothetical protein